MTTLFVVGKVTDPAAGAWEMMGVFSEEAEAQKHANAPNRFVGPLQLDQLLPDEATGWPGAYYPTGS